VPAEPSPTRALQRGQVFGVIIPPRPGALRGSQVVTSTQ
jgi:hypothetical protein